MTDFMHTKDKWADIEDLIRRWRRRFPDEYQQNMDWVKEARKDYKQTKYGDRPLRKGLLVHPHLLVYMQKFYPNLFDSNDDVRKFSQRFKQFVVDRGVLPVKG